MNHLLDDGLSPRTVQYVRAVLHRALEQALKWGLIARNVAGLVSAPRVKKAVAHPFTPDELSALLAAIRSQRLAPQFNDWLARVKADGFEL